MEGKVCISQACIVWQAPSPNRQNMQQMLGGSLGAVVAKLRTDRIDIYSASCFDGA